MNIKTILLIIALAFGCAFSMQAQKIAHANIDLILSLMPETKSMAQTLQTYQTQLAKKLEVKRNYGSSKLQEAEAAAQNNATEAELDVFRTELQKLEKEIQTEAADADQKMAKKRMDLMDPITEKLENAIKEVATSSGYDYIINSVDGSGVSIVLYGPEDRDLTKILMTKLGIAIPKEMTDGK
jgi:outer membrane protein